MLQSSRRVVTDEAGGVGSALDIFLEFGKISNDKVFRSESLPQELDYTAKKLKKPASTKLKTVPVSPKEPTQKEDTLGKNSWGNSEDENDDFNDEDDDGGNVETVHDDENPSFTLKDYEEEEQDEEYVHTPEKDKSDDEEKMYEEE
ncbi:hypothetical protein Tco_0565812 [Tanacetum coccineum]